MSDSKPVAFNKKSNAITSQYIEEIFIKLMTIVSQKPDEFVKNPENIQEILLAQQTMLIKEAKANEAEGKIKKAAKHKANDGEYGNLSYEEKVSSSKIKENEAKHEQVEKVMSDNGEDLACDDEVFLWEIYEFI